MSSESPNAILYDSNGEPLAVSNNAVIPSGGTGTSALLFAGSDGTDAHYILMDGSGRQIIVGAAAAGAAIAGNPVLIGGKDPSGNAQSVALAAEQSLYVVPAPNKQVVQSNATLTTSGSNTFSTYGTKEISLIVNIKNAPTGTTPTLTYTIQEIDPGDNVTAIGTSVTGASIIAVGTQILSLVVTTSGVIKVSWTITGTTPSFTGVYATLVSKISTVMSGINASGTQQPQIIDAFGQQSNIIFPDTVSLGLVSGGISVVAIGKIVGAPTTFTALQYTTYNETTTGAQRSMSSTSANDTSAGTGVRSVKITYYTSTLTGPFTETITMNGTTAVNTVNTNICFIEKMESVSVGTNNGPAGTVTLFNATAGGGGILAQYPGSSSGGQIDNTTLFAHHYVRAGKTAYIKWWNTRTDQGVASPTTDVIIQKLVAYDPTNINSPHKQITTENTTITTGSTTFEVVFPISIVVPGPARIIAFGLTRGGISTNISSSFGLVEL